MRCATPCSGLPHDSEMLFPRMMLAATNKTLVTASGGCMLALSLHSFEHIFCCNAQKGDNGVFGNGCGVQNLQLCSQCCSIAGYTPEFPATSPYVVAVGATQGVQSGLVHFCARDFIHSAESQCLWLTHIVRLVPLSVQPLSWIPQSRRCDACARGNHVWLCVGWCNHQWWRLFIHVSSSCLPVPCRSAIHNPKPPVRLAHVPLPRIQLKRRAHARVSGCRAVRQPIPHF